MCKADASRLGRCAPANTVYCVCHAQGVTGVTELSAWQPQVYGMQHMTLSSMTTAAFKVK